MTEILAIGRHRVRHGDVMDGLASLMAEERADLVFCDPPWGQGNLNYWLGQDVKMTGAPRRNLDHSAFLDRVMQQAALYARNLVLIAYGRRWREEVIEVARQHGLYHRGTVETFYRSGRGLFPLHLHLFSKGSVHLPVGYFEAITGTHGYATLRAAVSPVAVLGGLLLDPCCGKGLAARAAVENGMAFRGNELNRARLEKTIAFLRRHP